MAQSKKIKKLNKDIARWEETRDYLNREISAVEQSTANIILWMQENASKIQSTYFSVQEALLKKDQSSLVKTLDESVEITSLVLKMPTAEGQMILDVVSDVFGKKHPLIAKISSIPEDFPSHLLITEQNLKENPDTKTPNNNVELKDDESPIKQEPTNRNDEDWFLTKVKSLWGEPVDDEETLKLKQQLALVREEIVGLQTEKPFYIDSFFNWVDAVQNSDMDTPGDGEYTDFLSHTYRNPDYLLTQVYNDSNETLQVIFDDIYNKAGIYHGIKSGFNNKNIKTIIKTLNDRDMDETLLTGLLEEENQESLITWAFDAFPAGKQRTKAFKEILEIIPSELMRGKEYPEYPAFVDIFNAVLKGELTNQAITYVFRAIGNEKLEEHIENNLTTHVDKAIKYPKVAKGALHSLLNITDNDTDAIDFYVDMRIALEDKKPRSVKSLLKNAEANTLEQWLLLRDIFEPENTKSIMDEILAVAKVDKSRVDLFKSATAVGIPPISVDLLNDFDGLQKFISNLWSNTIEADAESSLNLFEGIIDFIKSNQSKEEYAELLTESLVPIVFGRGIEKSKRQKYFDILFANVDTDVEVAEILNNSSKNTAIAEYSDVMKQMADDIVGDLVEVETDGVATVLYLEKLSQIYPSYGTIGYFSGNNHEQSEVECSEKDTKTYINIIGERQDNINIEGKLISPKNWDIISYNEKTEEIDFIKGNKDRVILPLPIENAPVILKKIAGICKDSIDIQDAILLNPENFETVNYNNKTQELTIDQVVVLPDTSQGYFNDLLKEIQQRNKNILYLEEENLILNINIVDGLHKREFSSEGNDNLEQFIADILINGRNICIKDLFCEPDYSMDTNIKKLQAKEDASVFSLLEQLESKSNFIELTKDVSINKDCVVIAKSTSQEILTIVTHSDQYHLDINTNDKEFVIDWLSLENLLESSFIDVADDGYHFSVCGNDVAVKKSDLNEKSLQAKYTSILDDFLCNADDICEVSLLKEDSVVVLKSKNERVSIEVEKVDISKIVAKLKLQDTVLGKPKVNNKPKQDNSGKLLSFFNDKSDGAQFKGTHFKKIKKYKNNKI